LLGWGVIFTLFVLLPALLLAAGIAVALRRGVGGWSFRPGPLGTLAIVLAGLLLSMAIWRFRPGLLFLPIIIPFFWMWPRRTPKPDNSRRLEDGTVIDATSRPLE
jgi:hypothetical protein